MVIALAVPLLQALAAPSLELVAVHPLADPIALAVTADGRRLYAVEGTSIAILELEGAALVERGRIAIDATVVDLHVQGERLFVVGANRGAGVIELAAEPPSVRWFERVEDALCTQLAFDAERCVATFAARERSELRVYALDSLARVGAVRVPGLALDVELHAGHAYLALGPAGVARVALGVPGAPRELEVELGPALPSERVPASYRLGAPWARDLVVADGVLHVAADIAGLVEIGLGEAWRDAPVHAKPLALAGKPAYAIRIAAEGSRVVVGTTRGPAAACDGAPYGLFGPIGWNLDVGAVDPRSFEQGASEGLWVFEHAHDRPCALRRAEALEHSGWRKLVLRGARVFEQHLVTGTVVRELAPGTTETPDAWSVRTLATRRPPGLPAIDGAASLRDPRLVLFGIDTAGSLARGLVRFDERGAFVAARGLDALAPLGLAVGAQWLDAEPEREWFVSNGLRAWRVQRLTLGKEPRVESWDLVPPLPPDADRGGVRGQGYLNSVVAGELVLATRYGSRFGLVGYARDELQAAALRTAPGAALAVEPRWQVATHADAEAAPCFTWNACVFDLADGRRLAAVAAGANTHVGGEHFERPQLALFDVTRGVAAAPERLAWLHGTGAKGLAIAVRAFELAERRLIASVTSGGELLVFDVTDPTRARLERTWLAPPYGYDGVRDALLDLELWPSDPSTSGTANTDGARVTAWIAAGRSGLLTAELGALAGEGAATLTVVDDTPGWAAGLATTTIDGRRHLLLGDQRAGLRLYR